MKSLYNSLFREQKRRFHKRLKSKACNVAATKDFLIDKFLLYRNINHIEAVPADPSPPKRIQSIANVSLSQKGLYRNVKSRYSLEPSKKPMSRVSSSFALKRASVKSEQLESMFTSCQCLRGEIKVQNRAGQAKLGHLRQRYAEIRDSLSLPGERMNQSQALEELGISSI